MCIEHGTSHDQHRRLFCAPAAAHQHLASLASVKAWFGIPSSTADCVLRTRSGELRLHIADESWDPETRSLTSAGTVDGIDYHAFLTVRSIVHSIDRTTIIPGTEIWVHVTFAPNHHAAPTRQRIADLVERGLDHVAAELDCRPWQDPQ
ncbi:MAG: hypothetical protein RLN74_02340 [Ilumatobacter fluminis]